MKTRIMIGLPLIGLLAGLFYWDHFQPWPWFFFSLTILLLSAGAWELYQMASVPRLYQVAGSFAVALVAASSFWGCLNIVLPAVFLLEILLFFREPPSPEGIRRQSLTLYGLFYLGFLGSFFLQIRLVPQWGEVLVFYTLLVSKGTDIFAYFTGSFIGRHKWIPRISPGKTWEGLAGGCLGAGLIGYGCWWFFQGSKIFPWYSVFLFSIILGMVSQLGDLAESFLKRSFSVKDSGAFLPEFGGVLDLMDSLLFTGPVVFIVWSLTQQ